MVRLRLGVANLRGMAIRIGVDLGGTKIEVAALDDALRELVRRRVPTPAGDYPAILASITELVAGVERELGPCASVGIGTPGSVSPQTGLIRNANSTVLIGKPFARDLEHVLGRQIRMTNDANCFALSEATDGAGRACAGVFAVILGTGVGGGLAMHGRIVEGANAIAGEWGHNPMPWPNSGELPGPPCYCGKHGCIETFVSGPALMRQFAERTGAEVQATEIAQRAERGDLDASACMRTYVSCLARGLAHVVNIFDPDTIVLGGGVSNIGALYTDLPPAMQPYVFSDAFRTRIVPAVHGDSSGVRGAALLW